MRIRRLLPTLALFLPLGLRAQAPVIAAPPVQLFAALADQPGTHTGLVYDKNILQFAQGLLVANGMDEKRAAAALTGIALDTYHFKEPAFYTPEGMAALEASYKAAGWKHLVNGNQNPARSAQPTSMLTDLWLHFSGADIDQMTVLTRAPREMIVVQVSGDLRPLDLIHLSGKFGIPKVDPGAVMVPAPN